MKCLLSRVSCVRRECRDRATAQTGVPTPRADRQEHLRMFRFTGLSAKDPHVRLFSPRARVARGPGACRHRSLGMRRPNNLSTALRQLADPVLHFGFIQDADYTMVIPSSLAYHAAKEAEMRARLLPNERRFPPKNPDRLRAQLTTVHISPHGDAADFHAAFKRLVRVVCGFPGRLRLLIGSTDRWWPKHYSRLGLGLGPANPNCNPNPNPNLE